MTFAVIDPSKQLDLFPTSEPEIKGQLAAFAVILENLIDLMVRKGVLTKDEAQSLCRHSDIQTSFQIWDSLQGDEAPAELKRMVDQAERFLDSLRERMSKGS